MANFKKVNKTIKTTTGLDIEVVRGDGYVWFDGDDGFDKIESIYVNPVATPTTDLVRICLEEIKKERGTILDAKKKYEDFIAALPEDTRSEIEGEAFANSFAVEVHDEYADDLERWTVAFETARMYADGEFS